MGEGLAFADVFPILLILLAVIAFATLGFRRVLSRRRGTGVHPGPVAVPPEEAELEEGPVMCCMRCGSIHVRQPHLSEGLIPGAGEGFAWICARCRWRGPPLTFDDVTAYRQFIKGLHEDAAADDPAARPP